MKAIDIDDDHQVDQPYASKGGRSPFKFLPLGLHFEYKSTPNYNDFESEKTCLSQTSNQPGSSESSHLSSSIRPAIRPRHLRWPPSCICARRAHPFIPTSASPSAPARGERLREVHVDGRLARAPVRSHSADINGPRRIERNGAWSARHGARSAQRPGGLFLVLQGRE